MILRKDFSKYGLDDKEFEGLGSEM